jgi:FKBP-type peptidyl-prolyl cis-trans isomerase 2
MVKLQINDFVEVEYTGKTKPEGIIFDTTSKDVAKKEAIGNDNVKYGPVVVCIGKGHLIKGLDEKVVGKELGSYTIELPAADAFGRKEAKLVQMVPARKFLQQQVQPVPGLQVNIDGAMGLIKAVSGGRVIVDFNHPLSGKDVSYDIKLNRIVTDAKEKVTAMLDMQFNLSDAKVTVENNKAVVELKKEFPKAVSEQIAKNLKELTGVDIEFTAKKEETKAKPVDDKPKEAKPEAPKKV